MKREEEHEQSLRSRQGRAPHAEEPDRDVAHDPEPCPRHRRTSHIADGRVLRPACERGPDRLVIDALGDLGLAYLHVLETHDPAFTATVRQAWKGTLILNPATGASPTGPEQLALIEQGATDLLAFGRLFMANPDLPERLAVGAPLALPDMTKAYGGDAAGYTDYPTLDRAQTADAAV